MVCKLVIRKAFRYRVYPTADQQARLARWDSALRFLWNLAHEQRLMGLARCNGEKRYPTAFDQINELTCLRKELPWLADVPRDVSAQLLVELDKAWQRCFKKLGRAPRWKRRGVDVMGFCESHPRKWRLDGSTIRFPKLGNLRAAIHRPLEGTPKTCTLVRDGDQWFASISCEIEVPDPAPRHEPRVALDRGVVNAVADSDGRLVVNPKHFAAAMKRLARAQRNVSRKKKGSKNREKAKFRVMRMHRKARRQREHFVHGLSATYSKSHGTVVVEKLQIGNMVKANRGLARGILDSGWGMLVSQLKYKMAWSGGQVIEVPAAYSSQTCSTCGVVDSASRKTQSEFVCTSCGHVDHADLNAAKVLLTRANRSGLPGEGSPLGTLRTRKVLRVSRRKAQSSGL
jgi:putative transposase